jgi:ParB family chromosome partitioning protein
MAAIHACAGAYRDAGWNDIVVLPVGEPFHLWEHERRPKRKGGKVYVATSQCGEAAFYEGYVTGKEARKLAAGGIIAKPVRPEVSSPIQNYVDLHRHAAVRASLAVQPSLALRLMVAHAIAGSGLWHVRIEPQRAATDAIAQSVENCASEAAFDKKRRAVLAVLGFDPDTPTVTGGHDGEHGLSGLLARLLDLPDPAVLDILAIVIAETLEAASPLIETLGGLLAVNMARVWQADDALLDLIRDRELLGHVLAEVAGDAAAAGNEGATGKVKRKILRDCLTGENGRAKVEGWVPRWMAFPPSAYTKRGGVASVDGAASLAAQLPSTARAEPLAQAA